MPPENFNGEVNIEDFWDSVAKHTIARGFLPSEYKTDVDC